MRDHLKSAEFLTKLLDTQFKIFNLRFGIEPLLGLIPGIGDLISLGLSFYLVWIALKLEIPRPLLLRMIGNLTVDFILGTLPLVGDISDFFYKANVKNLEILKRYAKPQVIDAEVVP